MIGYYEVSPLLVRSCPSFAPVLAKYRAEYPAADELLYCVLACMAGHLLGLQTKGEKAEFPSAFALVERLYQDAEGYVQTAVTDALLYAIQVMAHHRGTAAEEFIAYLGPLTYHQWQLAQAQHGAV